METAGAQLTNISVHNNTCYNPATNWSEGQRWGAGGASEDGQQIGTLHSGAASPIPSNLNYFNNVFDQIGLCGIEHPSAGTPAGSQWQGAGNMAFDYNLYRRISGATPTICLVSPGAGNPTIATWAASDQTPAQEVHGLLTGLDPKFTDPANGNFTPQAGSPLLAAGTNLSGSGVVWDINHKPRPASGAITIGAIQQ